VEYLAEILTGSHSSLGLNHRRKFDPVKLMAFDSGARPLPKFLQRCELPPPGSSGQFSWAALVRTIVDDIGWSRTLLEGFCRLRSPTLGRCLGRPAYGH
jgi:hypothetical protein